MKRIWVGEKGIGRVFEQLGGIDVSKQHRRLDQIERPVKLTHQISSALRLGGDNNAVGAREILDR
jgi:hypothetical protein